MESPNRNCALFESALFRSDLCKHCFRNQTEHTVILNNINTTTNYNTKKPVVEEVSLKRAPASIRRSLTPQSIQIFTKELQSLPSKPPLPTTPKQHNGSGSGSNSSNISPLIISSNSSSSNSNNSPYKRPLPPVPNPVSKLRSTSNTPNSSPNSSTSSLSSSSASAFTLESTTTPTAATPTHTSPMIESLNLTRQSRSHSDTASSDKPPISGSSHSFLITPSSSSNSSNVATSNPKPIKKHNKSDSTGSNDRDAIKEPIILNSGQFGGSLQFSSSPNLSSSPSVPLPINSSQQLLKESKNQLIPPGSPSNRKYTNIAKSFIKLKLSAGSSGSGKKSSSASKLGLSSNIQLYNDENIEPQNKILYSIQSIISAIPGVTSNSVYAIMDILNNQPIDIDFHSYVNDQSMENLQKASKTIQKWIDSQHYVRMVIKVQSCARRFLAKKRLEWLSETYTKTILKERNIAFRQLIQQERRYNTNLQIIVAQYYKPLKSGSILSDHDFKSIFSSIEEIYQVHSKILHQFEQLHNKWPCIEGLGEFFLRIAPELKVYGDYVKNFKMAIDTLNRLTDENSKFASFIREACENTPGKVLDLMTLLSTPLNHLSVYERQLFNVLNSTPPNWVDYDNINNAVMMMKEVEKSVQENLAQAQNAATLLNIYRKVNNKKAIDPFVIPGRIFIHEGRLIKFDPKKKDQIYYYQLCNDIILFVKKPVNSKDLLKFKNCYQLSDVVVNDLSDSGQHKNIISVQNTKTNETYTFSIEDKNDKVSLVKQFSKLCTTNKSTIIYGVPLIDLINREQSSVGTMDMTTSGSGGLSNSVMVPMYIVKLCTILLGHVQCEGIFRISPNQSDVDSVKENLNKANSESVIDQILGKIQSPHILAALLKSYFRELQPPLLTHELFDKIVDLGDKELPTNETIGVFKQLIQNIPIPNQHTFQLLLRLLQHFSLSSETNKMTHSNLAIVFGPNLLKPTHQSIENSLKIPIINNVIAMVIENYNLLYSTKSNLTITISNNKEFIFKS
ncbi:pleckstrin (PH) domain-containing protein [Tieghemostelium lacteum]|uniref:Pleckstrin (PH) domain-containing protein n=1 Tax=Tieghemostelium lacteum TaxID=361077 RepID=A0A151Z9Q8_TIELA|nr:pleckstrin (PH) domain-containing protein [Tieghemostelium lacteum]|eukprot:KYQ90687.1 pleckstrin (PH) domain-containing protein [Tieghemostelium lacteum]